ncbi:DUF3574 domain-containing protein [Brevibacillus fortis]|uniref:DUF3574 domain-containing protein n=1 Tax=Brevibacillus fortis TaxID=2126352 RepID=UPI002E218757|nr:DUF3574 domain-containing protein [Brevibacillus fortis]
MKKIVSGMIGLCLVALLVLSLQSATNPLHAFASTNAATTTEAASKTENSALQSQFNLSHVVKIYVPSTMNGSTPVTDEVHAKYVDQSLTKFSNLFGGATAISGTGGWVDDNKKLIKEKVTIVYSFAEKLDNQALDEVVAYAKQLKKDMTQSAISLELDGKMYFIE